MILEGTGSNWQVRHSLYTSLLPPYIAVTILPIQQYRITYTKLLIQNYDKITNTKLIQNHTKFIGSIGTTIYDVKQKLMIRPVNAAALHYLLNNYQFLGEAIILTQNWSRRPKYKEGREKPPP